MTDSARLEAELAIAKLVDEYEGLRSKVEDPGSRTKEDMDRYHELNQAIANARTEFKTNYPPGAPAAEDAVAEPGTVTVSTNGG